jgi:uncharacterized membrane protein
MKKILKKSVGSLIVVCGMLWLDSCYYDNEETLYNKTTVDCTTIAATYDANVQPIINLKCATSGCHDASGAGSTVLLTYAQVKLSTDRINQRTIIDKTMPPGGGMTTDELNILKCWISNGTPQ